jgi:hypothetical protein
VYPNQDRVIPDPLRVTEYRKALAMPINLPDLLKMLSSVTETIEAFRNWRRKTEGDSWRIIDELEKNSVLCWSVIEKSEPVGDIVEALSTQEYDSLKREGFDFNAINRRRIYPYKDLEGTDLAFSAGKETGVFIDNIYAHIKELKRKFPYADDQKKRRWYTRVVNIQKRILLLLRHVRAHSN